MSCVGQRLEEGPGHIEFLRLGPVLGLWLLQHWGLVPQLVLGPVVGLGLGLGLELVWELVLELAWELGLVGELGLGVVQWL